MKIILNEQDISNLYNALGQLKYIEALPILQFLESKKFEEKQKENLKDNK